MRKLILCCAILFASVCLWEVTAFATSFAVDGVMYYIGSGLTVTVGNPSNVSGSGYDSSTAPADGSITILASVTNPSTSTNYNVTSINTSAFENCADITSVTFDGNVTTVGSNAFNKCTKLAMVTFNGDVTTIGSAFSGCTKLDTVTFKGNVTTIDNYAFDACSSLTSITIPNSVTTIGNAAFRDAGLTSVTIPSNVQTIDHNAFTNCTKLATVTFALPSKVETIGNNVFSNCALTSIVIPTSVKSIGDFTFFRCTKLDTVTFTAPSIVESIGVTNGSTFSGCSELTSIVIPSGVTRINNSTFSNCTKLDTVTFQGDVTFIGSNAFDTCSELTNIVIPSGVESIGSYAFRGCSKLETITIPNRVKTINSYTFSGCTKLDTVTFAETSIVGSIDTYAFQNCSSLTYIKIPNSVQSINTNVFNGCTNLTDVVIPSGVTTIGSGTFTNCGGTQTEIITLHAMNNCSYTARNRTPGSTSIPNNKIITKITGEVGVVLTNAGSVPLNLYKNNDTTTKVVIPAGGTITFAANDYYTFAPATVTFDSDGGDPVSQIDNITSGSTITKPTDPTKTNYTFGGWFKEAACTSPWSFGTDRVYIDITLYAKWISDTIQTHTVTFNSDGGIVTTQTIVDGEKAIEPTTPTKDGYTFGGWYKDDTTFNSAWNFATEIVTSDITLYAKWILDDVDDEDGADDEDDDDDTVTPTPVRRPPVQETAPPTAQEEFRTPAPELDNIIGTLIATITYISANSGSSVIIPVSIPNIPIEILAAAKGKDVNLVLDYRTHAITINGTTIGNLPKGQAVSLAVKEISSKTIKDLAGGKSVKQLEFTHKGDFLFDLQLTLWVGNKYNGEKLTLNIHDKDNNLIEAVDTAEVEKGKVTFTVPKGGRYVITHQ